MCFYVEMSRTVSFKTILQGMPIYCCLRVISLGKYAGPSRGFQFDDDNTFVFWYYSSHWTIIIIRHKSLFYSGWNT